MRVPCLAPGHGGSLGDVLAAHRGAVGGDVGLALGACARRRHFAGRDGAAASKPTDRARPGLGAGDALNAGYEEFPTRPQLSKEDTLTKDAKPGEVIQVKPGEPQPVFHPAPMLTQLRAKFPAEKVYQREGPGKKMLDYVSGETVIERLLEVAPEFSWTGRIVSVEDGRAIVEGHIQIGGKSGYGVGSAKMGGDVDSSLKAANTEALKNAAKNGFGIALELWNADYREYLARYRRLASGEESALKQEVFKIAREKLDKKQPSAAEVAKLFGVKAGALADADTLKEILVAEGVL